ncbi:hypothetical protein [Undibacterium flavidum]|uniref:Uncharacterized protein n=1 Tax=Undibacterium flavidum TaxID=2762297 RepID=A0ABR6YG22_9BURK|nr:hypothetical protein [Undibacterium flavidum]MBC3875486.1 hypothetical protein [Undibacterium flavidum]
MDNVFSAWIRSHPIKFLVVLSCWIFALDFLALKLHSESKSNSSNMQILHKETTNSESELDKLLRRLTRSGIHEVIRLGDSVSYQESAGSFSDNTKELTELGFIREYTAAEYADAKAKNEKISFGFKTTDLGRQAQAKLFEKLEFAVKN